MDSLVSFVVCHVLLSLNVVGTTGRKSASLFLDLEPRVHVVLEQTHLAGRKVPYFVNALERVALLECLLEFWSAPGSGDLPLFRSVVADPRFFQERTRDVLFGTGATLREDELVLASVRQDGMKEVGRG